MFEFILGVVLSPWVFFGVFVFAVICEAGVSRAGDWSGWGAFWSVLMLGLGWLLFRNHFPDVEVGLVEIAVGIIGYFLLGCLWSMWRYRCYVSDVITGIKERTAKANDPGLVRSAMEDAKRSTAPSRNQGFIVYNIVLFPISFVAHLLEDVIRAVNAFVRRYMIGVFNTIHRKMFGSFE